LWIRQPATLEVRLAVEVLRNSHFDLRFTPDRSDLERPIV
jgi:hypothetical protein